MTSFWMLFAVLLGAVTSAQAASHHRRPSGMFVAHYRIQPLPLAGAGGLNDRGQVAGVRYIGDSLNESGETPCRAFLWSRGRLIPLGKIGTLRDCTPSAISGVGKVVGAVTTDEQGERASHYADAFAWGAGRTQKLPGLDGRDANRAFDVNHAGMIVGSSGSSFVSRIMTDYQPDHAVIWRHGKIMDLGYGQAVAVNDRGQVVGESDRRVVDGFDGLAALWENGNIHLLGAGAASAINNRGQIVGSFGVEGTEHCFLYQGGHCRDLGVGDAAGINDRAQIIINGGWNNDKHDVALWQGGKRYNLLRLIRNPSGWASLSVTRINNAGVILGNGSYRGRPHAFLLTPQ